ncbi:hypothetical protein Tco_0855220 [Tanacetum coccineum]
MIIDDTVVCYDFIFMIIGSAVARVIHHPCSGLVIQSSLLFQEQRLCFTFRFVTESRVDEDSWDHCYSMCPLRSIRKEPTCSSLQWLSCPTSAVCGVVSDKAP